MMNAGAVTPSRPSAPIVFEADDFSLSERHSRLRRELLLGLAEGVIDAVARVGAERFMGSESAATEPTCVWITPSWRRAMR